MTPAALGTIFPVQLRAAGYRTGHFGKWHMQSPPGFNPAAQFDRYEAIGRNPYLKPQADGTTRHETDLVADRAIEFLQTQPKGQPFSLNLWFNAAHAEDNDRRPGVDTTRGRRPSMASTKTAPSLLRASVIRRFTTAIPIS